MVRRHRERVEYYERRVHETSHVPSNRVDVRSYMCPQRQMRWVQDVMINRTGKMRGVLGERYNYFAKEKRNRC